MNSKYYIYNNEETKTYDIYRRHSSSEDEKICSVYSVEYIPSILEGLSIEPDTISDYKDNPHFNQ